MFKWKQNEFFEKVDKNISRKENHKTLSLVCCLELHDAASHK